MFSLIPPFILPLLGLAPVAGPAVTAAAAATGELISETVTMLDDSGDAEKELQEAQQLALKLAIITTVSLGVTGFLIFRRIK